MKKTFFKITLLFFLAITIVFSIILFTYNMEEYNREKRNEIVELNQIHQLIKNGKNNEAYKKIDELQLRLKNNNESIGKTYIRKVWIFYILSLLFLIVVFLYLYIRVIKPFERLGKFAGEISKGNFDLPLYIERKNMFGEFTWAFDMMRKEVKQARKCEKEAIENNKTVIATISHDIRTPIASIRAYAEGLELNIDSNYDIRKSYVSVIMRKCDEVSELTNDMLLHCLSSLNELKINLGVYEAKDVFRDILDNILREKIIITEDKKIPSCKIQVDKGRLEQVFENIISNSIKYSYKREINIDYKLTNEYLCCTIRDYGPGILDEDIPFIFEKFYRGKNIGEESGGGLGLYIVKYIIEQMKGKIQVENYENGLKIVLSIKII